MGVALFFSILNKAYKYFYGKYKAKIDRRRAIFWREQDFKELQKKYLYVHDKRKEYIQELKTFLATCPNYFELGELKAKAARELINVEKGEIEREHERKIMHLKFKKEELEKEIRMREYYEKEDIVRNLDLTEKVFELKHLNKKQIEVLVEKGYTRVNEYDVLERKRIPVLVKPIGNHSITHAFLVWSVKRFLERFLEKKVEEFLTVEADLVFEFNGQENAVEIEKGSLVGKKKQLAEKIRDLNEKYPNRWMFLVSHRDLLKKYRPFGLTATRSNFQEKLAKMLKIPHSEITDVLEDLSTDYY